MDKDTDITLGVLAASGTALTSIYDFGPDGTTFKIAARLDIKADAKLAPEGKTLAIAMGSGGSFQALEGSTFQNGVATASVPHFTDFTVIAVGGPTGTDAGTDTGSDTSVVAGDCAFKGSYTLESKKCGTTDITAEWKMAIPSDTLVVTDKAGGGCTLKLTHSSPGKCVELETVNATVVSGSSYQLAYLGVESCNPAACKFTTNDAACVVGDRVATGTATLTNENGKLHIVRPTDTGDVCGGQSDDVVFAP